MNQITTIYCHFPKSYSNPIRKIPATPNYHAKKTPHYGAFFVCVWNGLFLVAFDVEGNSDVVVNELVRH